MTELFVPRCGGCGLREEHKFSCGVVRRSYLTRDLPQRDPGRSLTRPWLAKWPKPRN